MYEHLTNTKNDLKEALLAVSRIKVIQNKQNLEEQNRKKNVKVDSHVQTINEDINCENKNLLWQFSIPL